MTSQDLDALLADIDPVTAASPRLSAGALSLRDGILAHTGGRRSRFSRARPFLLVAATAVLVAAALGGAALIRTHAAPVASAWSAEAVQLADSVPRLLVGAAGWKVQDANQLTGTEGEVVFSNGKQTLQLNWRSGSLQDWLADRAASAGPPTSISINGAAATLFQYSRSTDFTALWSTEGQIMELRGTFPTRSAYVAVATTLHPVDVDAWLSALPANVVKPAAGVGAVAAMLTDIPLPPGFDEAALTADGKVSDRYQLGARVTGAVACGWIADWQQANASHNSKEAARAAAAMSGSRDWAILNEMNPDGDYPEEVWAYAAAMNNRTTLDPNGMPQHPLADPNSYKTALGCP